MDAGRLINIILEALERSRSVIPHYLYKPYTAGSVSAMDREIHMSIEVLNYELRRDLGTELYVEVVPTITETTVQGYLKLRRCVQDKEAEREWVEQKDVEPKKRQTKLQKLTHLLKGN